MYYCFFIRPCINCGSASIKPRVIFSEDPITKLLVKDKALPSSFTEDLWSMRPYFTWFVKEKANPGPNDITLGEALGKRHDDEVPTVERLKPFFRVCFTCYAQLKNE